MFEKISGQKIKQAIKSARMTQTQVAEKLGCDQSFISQMINEKTNISADNLKKIAEITKKPLNFFVDENLSAMENGSEVVSTRDFIEERMKRFEAEISLLRKEIELLKIKISSWF